MLLSVFHGFSQGWEPISLERADAGMAQLVLWWLCGLVSVSSSPPCPSQSLLQVLRNSQGWRQMGEHTQLRKSEEPSGFPPHPFPCSLQFVSPGTFRGELRNTACPTPAPAWKRQNPPAFLPNWEKKVEITTEGEKHEQSSSAQHSQGCSQHWDIGMYPAKYGEQWKWLQQHIRRNPRSTEVGKDPARLTDSGFVSKQESAPPGQSLAEGGQESLDLGSWNASAGQGHLSRAGHGEVAQGHTTST